MFNRQGISTTGLITRIVRDYDSYVKRNLDRGQSLGEMRVGYLKVKFMNLNLTNISRACKFQLQEESKNYGNQR